MNPKGRRVTGAGLHYKAKMTSELAGQNRSSLVKH